MLLSIWVILALNAVSVFVDALPIPVKRSDGLDVRSGGKPWTTKRQVQRPANLSEGQLVQISNLFGALLRNDRTEIQRAVSKIKSLDKRPTSTSRSKAAALQDPKKLKAEHTRILSNLFDAAMRNDGPKLNVALADIKALENVNTPGGRIIQALPPASKERPIASSAVHQERIMLLSNLFDAVLRKDREPDKLNRTIKNIKNLKQIAPSDKKSSDSSDGDEGDDGADEEGER